MNVTVKTTGYLVGEYITIKLKAKYAKDETQLHESLKRIWLLDEALKHRIDYSSIDTIQYNILYKNLERALIACWNAQEVVMDSLDPNEVYTAAKTTLIENKNRNVAIRALDEFFGESYYSHLEKTYKV